MGRTRSNLWPSRWLTAPPDGLPFKAKGALNMHRRWIRNEHRRHSRHPIEDLWGAGHRPGGFSGREGMHSLVRRIASAPIWGRAALGRPVEGGGNRAPKGHQFEKPWPGALPRTLENRGPGGGDGIDPSGLKVERTLGQCVAVLFANMGPSGGPTVFFSYDSLSGRGVYKVD